MTKELTLAEILALRDFIQLDIGGDFGIIRGKVSPSTPIPSADGYSVISWANEVYGCSDIRNPIAMFGSFYPAEQIPKRFQERKAKSNILPVYRDAGIVFENGVFRFSPSGFPIAGASFRCSGSDAYERFFERLQQEELVLTA